MWDGKRIAVIVPCFQEAILVGRMLERLPRWVDSIVTVDDASSDGTVEAILAVADPRVRLVRHETNRGVGAAIVTGYSCGLDAKAEVLVVMAGDDQMDPEDLPHLLGPICGGTADYVKGNRFRHRDRRKMPLLRRWGGRLLSALTRAATGLRVDDTQCGFTALDAQVALRLPLAELWPRFGYPNDLLGMLAGRRLRITEVPVRPVYAEERSGVRFWHLMQIAWIIGRRWWRERRRAEAAVEGRLAANVD